MAHRIALVCFEGDVDVAAVADAVRAALGRRGFDAVVGRPADEASAKSWDLSIVLRSLLRPAIANFDVGALLAEAGVAAGSVKVSKTWVFDD